MANRRPTSPWRAVTKNPMLVAKIGPAFAKAEGDKLRAAFKGAKRVSVLSTRFNEPSKEEVAGTNVVQT